MTIAVQLSTDRLPLLLLNAKAYRGPISACIYLYNSEEYFVVQKFWGQYEHVRKFVSIHLVYARDPDPGDPFADQGPEYTYPVNYLRNVARKYVETDFVLYLDADFIVPENLYAETTNGKIG